MQRCKEDVSHVVATYEGEHNHDVDGVLHRPISSSRQCGSATDQPPGLGRTSDPPSPTSPPDRSAPSQAQPLSPSVRSPRNAESSKGRTVDCGSGYETVLEEYVSSLMKDPDFTADLAAAVAREVHRKK